MFRFKLFYWNSLFSLGSLFGLEDLDDDLLFFDEEGADDAVS